MPRKNQYQDISVGLTEADRIRLSELAQLEGKTRTEVARAAILWYMDHYDEVKKQGKDTQIALAIRHSTGQLAEAMDSGVDRICKMLARQGVAVGTLYELAWASLPDDEEAKLAFQACVNLAKQKMVRRVQSDEAEIAERMKNVVESS